MKKLLSLLSVLTISGTAIPTTIAANPYQKQEQETKLENSEINYLQTNSILKKNNLKKINISEKYYNFKKNEAKNIKHYVGGILEELISTNEENLEFNNTIILNNKIYLNSFEEHKVYEYDPITEQKKCIINDADDITSGVVLNNKIYFGTWKWGSHSKVYEYDPITGKHKIVISNIRPVCDLIVLNNKIYVWSYDREIYEYDPITEQKKRIINEESGPINFWIILNNKIYIGTWGGNNKVYEYDPITEQKKCIINDADDITSGVVLNNKIYIGAKNKIVEYNPTISYKKDIIINSIEIKNTFILNNKLYFFTDSCKIYEYDPITGRHKIVIETVDLFCYIVTLNNKLYFTTFEEGNKVYEYDPITGKHKIVIETDDLFCYIVTLNNKLYFGCFGGKIYEYEPLESIESDIIYMKDQIKRGLYLQYKKQNPNSEIKKIYNINLENLEVYDVIIESKQKNKPLNLEDEINVCPDSNSTFINNSDLEQTQNTISCSKQLTETNTIQKMNGFSKSKSTANNDNWTAKWGGKLTLKAGGSAGIPLVAEGKVEVGFEVSHETSWGKSRTETITDTSNSSDTEIKTNTDTTTINVPSQPVKVPPRSKISISVTTWKNNIDLILNTSQKIEGIVSAEFIDKNNESKTIHISIKETMLRLLENHILHSKIKINDDDSINFFYDNKIKREIIMHQTEIGKAIPLSLDEQNVKFKDNTTGIVVLKN